MIPQSIIAVGWIPFTIVIVLCFIFSALYVAYFWNRYDKDLCSAVVGTFALCLVLLTSLLFPVDIFLVSYMKYPNGTFKEWATNETRESVENSVLYTYYILYSLMLFFIFFLLPFVYFFYEEKDDDILYNSWTRVGTAIKYSLIFVLLAVSLVLLGVFVPMQRRISHNSTDWEDVEYFISELATTKGDDGFAFTLAVLSTIGMCTLIFYAGFGLAAWPVGMIRGNSSVAAEHQEVRERYESNQEEISSLQNKRRTRNLSARDKNNLAALEESQRLISKADHYLNQIENTCFYKCRNIIRPMQIVIGFIGLLLGIVLWISLLLTNIDKIIHSGPKMGYLLETAHIIDPLDFVLVSSQKVFPVDYILFLLLVIFLVACTISGIQYLGLWFFFLKLYKVIHRRTKPQAIILSCAILMLSILAINIVMHQVLPQYTMYGSQHYIFYNPVNSSCLCEIKKCSPCAPEGECILSRGSILLMRFIYKIWVFGAIYYWGTWLLMLVGAISFAVVVIRSRYSTIHGYVEADSFDESDDDLIQP